MTEAPFCNTVRAASAVKLRSSDMSDAIKHLDTKGLMCPLPVLKARKALGTMAPGAILVVEATDPAAVIDFPHYCNESGHRLIAQSESGGIYSFRIERK